MNKSIANLLLAAGVLAPMYMSPKGGKNTQIRSLLNKAEKEYRKGGDVDQIVGSFAMAQELIHNPEWKKDVHSNPEKISLVDKFTKLGHELSS